MNSPRPTYIAVVGGSGHWSDRYHHAAILAARAHGENARVVAIVDPVCPHHLREKASLQQILKADRPAWLDVADLTNDQSSTMLDQFVQNQPIDLMIIATDPEHHYEYAAWALRNRINVLCDKPPVAIRAAASRIESAEAILPKFHHLLRLAAEFSDTARIAIPLRRRALSPYILVAKHLEEVFASTGEGVRYMTVIVNSGIHRFPAEFASSGAHGYTSGIGSLSHTGYHFIDLIAWYLSIARGRVHSVKITLPYILRVRDYLRTEGYAGLSHLLVSPEGAKSDHLPGEVLDAELDATFHLRLMDDSGGSLGLVSYSCNHTTYTPRSLNCPPVLQDPANHPRGGRMSHFTVDIQQGSLQSVTICQNNESHRSSSIDVFIRRHPNLGSRKVRKLYRNAYSQGTTLFELSREFIHFSAPEGKNSLAPKLLTYLEDQRTTMEIYSAFYRLAALQAKGISGELTIHL